MQIRKQLIVLFLVLSTLAIFAVLIIQSRIPSLNTDSLSYPIVSTPTAAITQPDVVIDQQQDEQTGLKNDEQKKAFEPEIIIESTPLVSITPQEQPSNQTPANNPAPVDQPVIVEIFTPTEGQSYYNVPEATPYEMYPRHCPYYVDIYLSGRIIHPVYGELPDQELFWSMNGGSESAYGNNFNYRFCGHWDTPYSYTVGLSYAITTNTFAEDSVTITILPPQ